MSKPEGISDVETADDVFSALAHPARRQILLSVHNRGTCTSGDIANRFDCSWPTTSRHLAKLVETELLSVSKIGREQRAERKTIRHEVSEEQLGFLLHGGAQRLIEVRVDFRVGIGVRQLLGVQPLRGEPFSQAHRLGIG